MLFKFEEDISTEDIYKIKEIERYKLSQEKKTLTNKKETSTQTLFFSKSEAQLRYVQRN
jgi:hypothetical protein